MAVFSLICQLSAGRGLSPVCSRPFGKMASAQVLSFAVFLFLTVHGNAVGKSGMILYCKIMMLMIVNIV